jgi:hypothetical protein
MELIEEHSTHSKNFDSEIKTEKEKVYSTIGSSVTNGYVLIFQEQPSMHSQFILIKCKEYVLRSLSAKSIL